MKKGGLLVKYFFIFLIIFVMLPIINAGCGPYEAQAQMVGPFCFDVGGSSCTGTVNMKNYCEDNYKLFNLTNCVINEHSSFAYSERYYPEVRLLLHENFIDIPPNWTLEFYHPSSDGKITLAYVYNYTGIEIFCDTKNINRSEFHFLVSDSKNIYHLDGTYNKAERQNYVVPWYLYVGLLVIIIGLAILIYSGFNSIRKKKKRK